MQRNWHTPTTVNRERQHAALNQKNIKDILALTPMQQGMLFHYLENPQNDYYFEQLCLDIPGEIHPQRFEQAWNVVIETNEMLRTVFRWEKLENPIQVILKKHQLHPIYHDFSDRSANEVNKLLEEVKTKDRNTPFDLRQVPFRVTLCKKGPKKYETIVSHHHIIYDGWSSGIILKEFFNHYNTLANGKEPVKPCKTEFKEFIRWQQEQDKSAEEKFWQDYLRGVEASTGLPIKRKSITTTSYTAAKVSITFPAEVNTRIEHFIKVHCCTLATLIYSTWGILLQRYNNSNDVIFGTTVSGRPPSIPGIEEMVGLFINTLPLRVANSPGEKIKNFINGITGTLRTREAYMSIPLVNISKYISPGTGETLFDTVVVMENYPLEIPDSHSQVHYPKSRLSLHSYSMNEITHYTLSLGISTIPGTTGIKVVLYYNQEVLEDEAVKRLAGHFRSILEAIIKNPGKKIHQLELLSKKEKQQLLLEFNNTRAGYREDQTLHQLFVRQVERTPDNIAVIGPLQVKHRTYKTYMTYISYRELDEQSNQLTYRLKQRGVKPNTIAAIMAERSIQMVIGIFGILKAGGAYLPIDPEYPLERILFMLKDTGASILLTGTKTTKNMSFTALESLGPHGNEPGARVLHVTKKRPQVKAFDSLPIPDRSLVDYRKYHQFIGEALARHTFTLQATRGCPFKCAFCHKIWPRTHVYRSAEHVFHEVDTLYQIGARRFMFVDDIFNLEKENCHRFFELIIKNRLKVQLFFANGLRGDILTKDTIDLMVAAGTVDFDFSLESASPRLQELMQKKLNIEKLEETINYIINRHPHVIIELQTMLGFPTETEEEALMTLDFIKRLKWIDFPYVHFLRIFPGTDMAEIAAENGISRETIERTSYLAFHEYSETMPFSEEFAKLYQAKYFHEYFLVKERFVRVLQKQMKILTESELLQKYDSFFPIAIKSFSRLLDLVGISRKDLPGAQFPAEDYMAVPEINEKIKNIFPAKQPHKNALNILLLDLSQFFSHEAEMFYDVTEAPLGLMYLLTYLNRQYGKKINGKIAKSRIDFDSYKELNTIINDFKPHIIGVRTLNHYKDFFHQTLRLIKQWGINVPIIAGGPYATCSYREILENSPVDIVVLGEGEITFSEIIGKMLVNSNKLPGEKVLKDIEGIVFIENESTFKKKTKKISRDIIFLDEPGPINIEEYTNPDPAATVDLAYIIYTSGSTGQPKGVLVEHKNVIAYLHAFRDEFQVTAQDIVLQQASYSFDAFVEEIYPVLLAGGKLVLPPKETVMDITLLKDYIKKQHVTIVDCSPLLLDQLNKQADAQLLSTVHTFISGGDVLKKKYIDNLLKKRRVYNTYGPTETTVCATYYKLPADSRENIPIGKPITNYNIHILDRNFQLQPVGVPGELSISGAGVTRGYLNNPELTKEKFCLRRARCFLLEQASGSSIYRSHWSYRSYTTYKSYMTGDLACWLDDGNIEFFGRIDHQVKIRGFRIELGEIENQLLNHGEIKQAVVTVNFDIHGDKYLCAYIVSGKTIEREELTAYLSHRLPGYMIPGYFINLERLPLTSGGKVNRRELSVPVLTAGKNHVPPVNNREKALVEIWAEVLGLNKSQVGIHDNFFYLGGHSLKAVGLLGRIFKKFSVEIPISQLFKTPTVRGISDYISREKNAGYLYSPIRPAPPKDLYPLSPAQKRIYIMQQVEPGSTAYNMSTILVLEGKLAGKRLENAFRKLIQRHESLRTSFHLIEGTPVQKIHQDIEFELECKEELHAPCAMLHASAKKDFTRPFDLSQAPLLKVGLIKTKPAEHLLMLDMHHIISDAVSVDIMVRDLVKLYLGEVLPGLKLQYKDFSQWQNDRLASGEINKQEEYWLEEFRIPPPLLNIPTDYSRPRKKNFAGNQLTFTISGEEEVKLRALARRENATMFIILLAITNILLSKLGRQEDIVIGTVVAGRRHPDLEQVIGVFVNALALRNYPKKDKTFIQFLREVKKRTLKAFDNQDYQFEDLVEKVIRKRNPGRNPIFDVVLAFIPRHNNGATFTGQPEKTKELDLRIKPYGNHEPGQAKFDITLTGSDREEDLLFQLEYSTELFKKETINWFIMYFKKIVSTITADESLQLKNITMSHDLFTASDVYQDTEIEFEF